jgi:hypothetical protein
MQVARKWLLANTVSRQTALSAGSRDRQIATAVSYEK